MDQGEQSGAALSGGLDAEQGDGGYPDWMLLTMEDEVIQASRGLLPLTARMRNTVHP